MRKGIKVFCLFFVLLCFAMSTFSYAQEEGFIKRVWRRFISKPQPEKKEEAAREEVVRKEEVVEEEVRAVPPGEAPEEPELTRDELIEMLRGNFDAYGDELSLRIPSLVKKTDEEGRAAYLFRNAAGQEVNLEDLDEETLLSLYNRVVNQAALIRREETILQLERLRRIQEMQRQQQVTQPPQAPTFPQMPQVLPPAVPPSQPPTGYTPPTVMPPQPPQQPPQQPPMPPQPPQERR